MVGPARPRRLRPLAALCSLLRDGALVLALLGGALPAPAQPAAASVQAAADDTLILTVRSNGVPRGEFTLLRRRDGDYWIAADDVGRFRIDPVPAARRDLGGQAFYSLRALGASEIRYDEATLSLDAMFPVAALEATQIDLGNRPQTIDSTSSPRSMILSYRLSGRGGTGLPDSATLDDALNLRLGKLLLRQETRLSSMPQSRGFSRGVTQVVWDEPSIATRFAAGDLVSTAGAFGSSLTGAGVLVQRIFDMKPDLIRQPVARVRTSTGLPADVVVDVDGSTVYRGTVGPGPIDIDNLLQYGGLRNIRVTITDASGRREVIDRPFFFTNSVLAQGLHEYSYFAGRRSELGPDFRRRYRKEAWQAYHRYGWTDSVTVSAGGEGSADFTNAGAGIALRSDMLGIASLEAVASHDRLQGTTRQGWSARYSYIIPLGSVYASRRVYEDGFTSFATGPFTPFLRSETRVGFARQFGRMNVGAEWGRTQDAVGDQRSFGVRASRALDSRRSLSVEVLSSRQPDRRDVTALLLFRMDLDGGSWLGTSVERNRDGHVVTSETGRTIPQGEGAGWRAGVSGGSAPSRDLAFGNATWNLSKATVDANVSNGLHAGAGSYGELAVSGGIAAIDGYWGATRRVDDSFVVAKLGVPQPGVEVSINSQVQGRTDETGALLIPQVSSYTRQQVTVNDKQVGLQYELQERQRIVVPAYRSGTVVDFGGREVHAVAGIAWRRTAEGKRVPIENRAFALRSETGTAKVETGSGGDFYLEGLGVGRYTGRLQHDGRTYSCTLDVPAFTEAVYEAPEGINCD